MKISQCDLGQLVDLLIQTNCNLILQGTAIPTEYWTLNWKKKKSDLKINYGVTADKNLSSYCDAMHKVAYRLNVQIE